MRIAVLGVGLIGGSVGLAARRSVADAEVVGFGRDPARLELARELGAIDTVAGSLEEALEGAAACFACAPVGALPEQVSAALAAAPEDCVVTDVGSTKRRLLDAIDDPRFVGGHPIAGAETSGVEHARADLFQDAVWYLTPTERTSGLLYERLHRLLKDLGARPVAIDPETHDRLVAVFSHLPHVLANVLVRQAAGRLLDEGEALRQVGPSFRDASARGRRQHGHVGRRLPLEPGGGGGGGAALRPLARRGGRPARGRTATWPRWNDAAREDRRRLLEADLTGRPVHELQADGSEPPRYRRPGGAGARPSRGEHRGHDARAGLRHAHRRDDALGRGRRRGRPRHGADRRARLPRSRAVTRRARFEPSGPLQGTYTPPADKSISHRAALFAAMSDEPVAVRNYLQVGRHRVHAQRAPEPRGRGGGRRGRRRCSSAAWASTRRSRPPAACSTWATRGTLMRLLPGWLAGQPGRAWTLDGDESIRRRPVDRVAEPLAAMGAGVEARDGRFPPFTVTRRRARRASSTRCRWRAPRSSPAC